jgi:hypothetical protein
MKQVTKDPTEIDGVIWSIIFDPSAILPWSITNVNPSWSLLKIKVYMLGLYNLNWSSPRDGRPQVSRDTISFIILKRCIHVVPFFLFLASQFPILVVHPSMPIVTIIVYVIPH